MSNLIYIMGKSATGKDTIYQKIKEKIEANTYVPYTTRPQRNGEHEGVEYHFITRQEFLELDKQEKVMEHRDYNVINSEGKKDIWTYATIDDEQWKRSGDFLTIGTLESYTSILNYLKYHADKNINILPIYISIDEEERKARAIKREEKQEKPNYEEMERRFKSDNIDFSEEKLNEAGITSMQTFENYDLQECIEKILNYIKVNTIAKESDNEER